MSRACSRAKKVLLRSLFCYIFVCAALWVCIIATEGNITRLKAMKYVGINFRPGYNLLAKKYPAETFGIHVGQE
jgi:hypothetical protein